MDILNPENLLVLFKAPEGQDEFDEWCRQDDILPFLLADAGDDYVVIYASLDHAYIYALLIPQHVNLEEHGQDLRGWSSNPFSGWGLVASQEDAWIEKPCQSEGSEILKEATQIIFGRSFEGHADKHTYFEVNQEITQVLDLHHITERDAWCRLDRHGDIEECIKHVEFEGGRAIVVKSDVLARYCAASQTQLLRMFDFTRFRKGNFPGWGDGREERNLTEYPGIAVWLTVQPGVGSYSRGVQIIEPKMTAASVRDEIWGLNDEEGKEYASFIAQDWKNKRIVEISCAPGATVNYFTKSNLPFELSPAYFRPEVLSKYKADRQKYTLQDRSITCRGAWHLETYDINQAGQVHTYLVYLRRLPYEEQLHWKQYNEAPKTGLSKRAFTTDFEGQWYDEYDPLPALKSRLRALLDSSCPWWILPDPDKLDEVQYPVTTSRDEWANEVMGLDQLLVEGLVQKWLKAKAIELGQAPTANMRQLKLLERCLIGLGFEEDHAYEVMGPFHELHNLRSLVRGHRWGTEATSESKRILKEFGEFKRHFTSLCQRCDESLELIVEGFSEYESRCESGN
ncbi:hypothetical protein [Billgrantia montanilacus]|uniref:Uncharacterized protein n=1 Tax=Billgrantia montanilacus TaxID=2282305 RepID=A0A368TVG6_9GAMM|nr:hypothetical protein [Halomonas montanilacus]RCV88346.1 hypothetical protein DU505_13710 [Halomonas montanilacus]